MSTDRLKEKTLSGLFYKTLERIALQGVSLIISIILARLLLPEDFGNVSIVLISVTLIDVIVNYGLGSALIQKKNPDSLDFSTCFISSFLFSIFVFIIVFFSAPYLASFLNNGDLTTIIRVLSVRVVFSAVLSIQNAYVAKFFLFKKTIISTFFSSIISGCLGIVLAYSGFGEWALVWQSLSSSVLSVIILSLLLRIKLPIKFSFYRLKKLLGFGTRLLINGLLNSLYEELRSIIIAKKYSTTDLAFYEKGRNFPKMISNNVNAIIDGVLLSTMSSVQDDKTELVKVLSKSVSISMYILSPMLIGLFMVSDDLIIFLYTEKWISAAYYIKVFCLAFFTMPIITLHYNAIKAIGKSGIVLVVDTITKIVGTIILLIVLHFGVKYIAISIIGLNVLTTIIVIIISVHLFSYMLFRQIKDIFFDCIPALFMGGVILSIGYLHMSLFVGLVCKIIIGILTFFLFSLCTNNKSFIYLLSIVRKKDE